MKRIVLVMVFLTAIIAGFGQKSMRQTASNYLKSGDLDKAVEAINQCIQDPSTAQDARAWFIRGNIYLEIANTKEDKYKSLDPDPLTKALDSYKKAAEYDTKKEYTEDIFQKLSWQRNNYFNAAVDAYNKKQYKEAMTDFESGANTLAILNIPDTLSLFYAAACAGLANDRVKAKQYYIELIHQNYNSPAVYIALSDIYRGEKDSANALKVIREGQKRYPNDLKMVLGETNVYLTFGNTDKALKNLKYSIQKDTTNPTVYFAMGTIYDNLSADTLKPVQTRRECFNEAVDAYQKALKLNPAYFDANYNLGALYVNKAAAINDVANKLPLDADAQFNQLKKEADGYLEQALP
ncbi:MAG TPA: tetratricopeptide repeat protein, partial [Bacteroidales bacterium]|nr:tetratricopeptide repeat protein [Bacteroidales bacterium]